MGGMVGLVGVYNLVVIDIRVAIVGSESKSSFKCAGEVVNINVRFVSGTLVLPNNQVFVDVRMGGTSLDSEVGKSRCSRGLHIDELNDSRLRGLVYGKVRVNNVVSINVW